MRNRRKVRKLKITKTCETCKNSQSFQIVLSYFLFDFHKCCSKILVLLIRLKLNNFKTLFFRRRKGFRRQTSSPCRSAATTWWSRCRCRCWNVWKMKFLRFLWSSTPSTRTSRPCRLALTFSVFMGITGTRKQFS